MHDHLHEQPGSRLLRVRVVADELDISIRSVWRLIELHELETVRVLRTVRITRASLDSFIARGGSSKPTTPPSQ